MHSNTSIELNQFRSLFVQCNEKSTIPLTPKLSLIWWRCLYCKCNETMEMALAINQLPNYNFIDAKNSNHHTQSKPFKYSCDSIKKIDYFSKWKCNEKFTLPKNRHRWYFVLFLASSSICGISLDVSSCLLLILPQIHRFFLSTKKNYFIPFRNSNTRCVWVFFSFSLDCCIVSPFYLFLNSVVGSFNQQKFIFFGIWTFCKSISKS